VIGLPTAVHRNGYNIEAACELYPRTIPRHPKSMQEKQHRHCSQDQIARNALRSQPGEALRSQRDTMHSTQQRRETHYSS
jgi:hypothetical protein